MKEIKTSYPGQEAMIKHLFMNSSPEEILAISKTACDALHGNLDGRKITHDEELFTDVFHYIYKTLLSKNIELDPDLIPLLLDSKPSMDFIHVPYTDFFINNKIIHDGVIYAGFSCMNNFLYETHGENSWFLSSYVYDDQDGSKILSVSSDVTPETYGKKREFIVKIVSNLIDLINNHPGEISFSELRVFNNEKRQKRGKCSRHDLTYLRLHGKLKLYAQHYRTIRGKIHVKFLVKGHWRRYESARYVNMQGKKVWVYPFYKGDSVGEDVTRHRLRIKN